MKIEIQTFTDSDHSLRYTFYESWFNKSIIVVKEERFSDEDWSVVNSMPIPKTLFSLLRPTGSASTTGTNICSVVLDDTTFHAKTVEDRLHLPLHVRKTLLDRDCEEIPLYENQTGYFNDVETLEWFWDIPKETRKSNESELYTNSSLFTDLAIPNTMDDCSGEIFICETPSSATALETAAYVVDMNAEDVSMSESPPTPEKKNEPNDHLECPPAPKKRRPIRRPHFPMKAQPLTFSEF